MEISKLYIEIESILENELSADTENVGDDDEVPYVKYIPETTKSIEQLVIDKLEGFGKFILMEGFEPQTDGKQKWFGKGDEVFYLNELIELYLNK